MKKIKFVSPKQEDRLASRIVKIMDPARTYLLRAEMPDYSNLKDEDARSVMSFAHSSLVNAVKAVFEVHAVYGEMRLVKKMASQYPWRSRALSKSEHLHLAWMLYVNLCYLFEEKYKRLGETVNPALMLFRRKASVDIGTGVKAIKKSVGAAIAARGRHWHQWNVGHKKIADYRLFEFIEMGDKWPDDWPSLNVLFQVSRDALKEDIDVAIAAMVRILDEIFDTIDTDLPDAIRQFNKTVEKANARAARA